MAGNIKFDPASEAAKRLQDDIFEKIKELWNVDVPDDSVAQYTLRLVARGSDRKKMQASLDGILTPDVITPLLEWLYKYIRLHKDELVNSTSKKEVAARPAPKGKSTARGKAAEQTAANEAVETHPLLLEDANHDVQGSSPRSDAGAAEATQQDSGAEQQQQQPAQQHWEQQLAEVQAQHDRQASQLHAQDINGTDHKEAADSISPDIESKRSRKPIQWTPMEQQQQQQQQQQQGQEQRGHGRQRIEFDAKRVAAESSGSRQLERSSRDWRDSHGRGHDDQAGSRREAAISTRSRRDDGFGSQRHRDGEPSPRQCSSPSGRHRSRSRSRGRAGDIPEREMARSRSRSRSRSPSPVPAALRGRLRSVVSTDHPLPAAVGGASAKLLRNALFGSLAGGGAGAASRGAVGHAEAVLVGSRAQRTAGQMDLEAPLPSRDQGFEGSGAASTRRRRSGNVADDVRHADAGPATGQHRGRVFDRLQPVEPAGRSTAVKPQQQERLSVFDRIQRLGGDEHGVGRKRPADDMAGLPSKRGFLQDVGRGFDEYGAATEPRMMPPPQSRAQQQQEAPPSQAGRQLLAAAGPSSEAASRHAAGGAQPAAAAAAGAAARSAGTRPTAAPAAAGDDKQKKELQKMKEQMELLMRDIAQMKQGIPLPPAAAAPAAAVARLEVDQRSVVVTNVHPAATELILKAHFSPCEPINRITIVRNKVTGQPTGKAYIEFGNVDMASLALSLSGSPLLGVPIQVFKKAAIAPVAATGAVPVTNGMAWDGSLPARAGQPAHDQTAANLNKPLTVSKVWRRDTAAAAPVDAVGGANRERNGLGAVH